MDCITLQAFYSRSAVPINEIFPLNVQQAHEVSSSNEFVTQRSAAGKRLIKKEHVSASSPLTNGSCETNDNVRQNSGTNGANAKPSTKIKKYICHVCDKSFAYKHVLENHARTHTGEKPFKCDKCPKRFTRGHHLATHKRLHTGEKPYECLQCGKRFVQIANLNRHIRVHEGVRTVQRSNPSDYCTSEFYDDEQVARPGGEKCRAESRHLENRKFSTNCVTAVAEKRVDSEEAATIKHENQDSIVVDELRNCTLSDNNECVQCEKIFVRVGQKPVARGQCPGQERRFKNRRRSKNRVTTEKKREDATKHEKRDSIVAEESRECTFNDNSASNDSRTSAGSISRMPNNGYHQPWVRTSIPSSAHLSLLPEPLNLSLKLQTGPVDLSVKKRYSSTNNNNNNSRSGSSNSGDSSRSMSPIDETDLWPMME